jgi:hypothetical protein
MVEGKYLHFTAEVEDRIEHALNSYTVGFFVEYSAEKLFMQFFIPGLKLPETIDVRLPLGPENIPLFSVKVERFEDLLGTTGFFPFRALPKPE